MYVETRDQEKDEPRWASFTEPAGTANLQVSVLREDGEARAPGRERYPSEHSCDRTRWFGAQGLQEVREPPAQGAELSWNHESVHPDFEALLPK
jgi:hypothetical protein